MLDWYSSMWQGEWIQVGKHSSGYHPRELPQPKKAGQHLNPGSTQNTTKILLKKATPRHKIVRFTRVEMKEKFLRAAREKGQVTHKGKTLDSQLISWQKLYKLEGSAGQYSTSLKKKTFNPEFQIWPNKLPKWRRNKILYRKAIAERFRHYKTCFTRAPEGSTKHGKEQPVPATVKMYPMVKNNDAMKKLHQLTGKTTSQ